MKMAKLKVVTVVKWGGSIGVWSCSGNPALASAVYLETPPPPNSFFVRHPSTGSQGPDGGCHWACALWRVTVLPAWEQDQPLGTLGLSGAWVTSVLWILPSGDMLCAIRGIAALSRSPLWSSSMEHGSFLSDGRIHDQKRFAGRQLVANYDWNLWGPYAQICWCLMLVVKMKKPKIWKEFFCLLALHSWSNAD